MPLYRTLLALITLSFLFAGHVSAKPKLNFNRWEFTEFVGPNPAVSAYPAVVNSRGIVAGQWTEDGGQFFKCFLQNKRGVNQVLTINLNNGGPASAFPIGIDDKSRVLGLYEAQSGFGFNRTFYFDGTTAVDFNAPNCSSTTGISMSSDGRILCRGTDSVTAVEKTFTWKKGVFTPAPTVTGFDEYSFVSINASGDLLGVGYEANYDRRTFFTQKSGKNKIKTVANYVGAGIETEYTQITDDGYLVGYIVDTNISNDLIGNPWTGFVLRNDTFHLLEIDQAVLGTGIHYFADNYLVGFYYDANGQAFQVVGD